MGDKTLIDLHEHDPDGLQRLGAGVDLAKRPETEDQSEVNFGHLTIGAGVQIRGSVQVCLAGKVTIEEGAIVGPNVTILTETGEEGGIVIGKRASVRNCIIRPGTNIPDETEIYGPGEVDNMDMPKI